MKKILLSTCICLGFAIAANAQGWDYIQPQQDNYQGQPVQYQQVPVQVQIPVPVQNGNYQAATYQQPVQQGVYYNTQQQQRVIYQQPQQGGRYNPETQRAYNPTQTRTRVSQKEQAQYQPMFYITPRAGYGYTSFSDDDASSAVLGAAVGMYIWKGFRADIEIDYHFQGEVVDHIDYSQWDYSINGYYEFLQGNTFRPFVGVGIGASTSKFEAKLGGFSADASETNLMLSAQAGFVIDLTKNIAFEAMGRYRYLNTSGDVYNLELLGGVRFSF